jgi:hypothetical protein
MALGAHLSEWARRAVYIGSQQRIDGLALGKGGVDSKRA